MSRKPIQQWTGSTVNEPVALVKRLCLKHPNKTSQELVLLATSRGVALGTAKVYVSRFKNNK